MYVVEKHQYRASDKIQINQFIWCMDKNNKMDQSLEERVSVLTFL